MGAIDRSGEVGEMLRRLRDLETQNPDLHSSHLSSGTRSVAIGDSADAQDYAVAFGFDANAYGVDSVAIGESADANDNSVAIGIGATGDGFSSVAIGDGSFAAYRSAAVGRRAAANADRSAAFGPLATASSADEVAVGASTARVTVAGRFGITSGWAPTGSADSAGSFGDIATDGDYLFVKGSSGWKRVALSTF